jgi:hypothetical protein
MEMINVTDRTIVITAKSNIRTTPVADAVAWALGCLFGWRRGLESELAFCVSSVAAVRGVQDVFAASRS